MHTYTYLYTDIQTRHPCKPCYKPRAMKQIELITQTGSQIHMQRKHCSACFRDHRCLAVESEEAGAKTSLGLGGRDWARRASGPDFPARAVLRPGLRCSGCLSCCGGCPRLTIVRVRISPISGIPWRTRACLPRPFALQRDLAHDQFAEALLRYGVKRLFNV